VRVAAGFHFHFQKISGWQWVLDHIGYSMGLARTTLYISLVAVAVGLLLALVLGVAAGRAPKIVPPTLGITTVIYAIPSLAAFVALLDVTGLSDITVIVPLAGYALAILARSVFDGFGSVADEVRVVATAMGYRRLRRRLTVELPAAVPVIVAGLRVAVVSSISLSTVGSLLGIGGLGTLFTEGENNNFLTEIVFGVVAVGFWALVCDAMLILAGRLLAPWSRRPR
jgi:osmoprotectant transport system permease protein